MTRIPRFNPEPELSRLRSEFSAAMERVLDSGRLLLGAETQALEAELSASLGGGEAVAVGSGTAAITLSLMALDVSAGDEVLTVANAGVPGASAICSAGATPVFVDVEPTSCLMDVGKAASAVSPRTRAVLAVHLYGNMVDIEALRDTLPPSIAIIEDCAQSQGSKLRGRPAGARGDAAIFSFYPTKNLGGLEDGGLVFAQQHDILERVRRHRNYGCDDQGASIMPGFNSRMGELTAATLRVKLRHFPALIAERQELEAHYRRHLPDGFEPLATTPGCSPAPYLMVVKTADRDQTIARLRQSDIEAAVHYPIPAHTMAAFQRSAQQELPETERACREVLSLPLYPGLEMSDVERVCSALGTDHGPRASLQPPRDANE